MVVEKIFQYGRERKHYPKILRAVRSVEKAESVESVLCKPKIWVDLVRVGG